MQKVEKAGKAKVGKTGGWIRVVYLYLVSAITMVMVIISAVGLLKIVLERYVFDVKQWSELENPKTYYECTDDMLFYVTDYKTGNRTLKDPKMTAERMETERKACIDETKENREFQASNDIKRDMVWWLAMLIVSLPLYLLHWAMIRNEQRK